MKPRRLPAPEPDDEDAFAELCAAVVEAMQVPEVAEAVAEALGHYLPAPPTSARPVVARHSPPARGRH